MRAAKTGGDDRVEFLVDRSIYATREAASLVRKHSRLGGAVTLDLQHHYSGPIQALYWIELCRDRAYGHHDLVRRIDAAFPAALRAMRQVLPADGPLSLVSLGPGDGEIDIRLLRHLERSEELHGYLGVDFSFGLLAFAVNRILHSSRLSTRFPVRAIFGDFTALSPRALDVAGRATHRLFSLTGFTLGNYPEPALLRRIAALMAGEDFLLVDARLHTLELWDGRRRLSREERDSVLASYAHEGCNRFVFGPVETVTTSTATDVEFGYDLCRRITRVPRALNAVIYCRDLRTRMRVTGRPVHRRRLNLAATTLYSFDELGEWFPSQGLELVWSVKTGTVCLFLLRRAARRP